jgi:hypothetical protein
MFHPVGSKATVCAFPYMPGMILTGRAPLLSLPVHELDLVTPDPPPGTESHLLPWVIKTKESK